MLYLTGFITIRNYTTLKQLFIFKLWELCFITIRNYTTLKLTEPQESDRKSFITIRNYTTLKPQILKMRFEKFRAHYKNTGKFL